MLNRYRFRPGLVTTTAFLVLLPVFIGLGYWQLERAAEKTAMRDRLVERGEMEPVDVNRQKLDAEQMNYRLARVSGRYHVDLSIYLDNKVLDGVPGYHILTPLEIGPPADRDGRFILVNRGWTAWGDSRDTLPDIDAPSGPVELRGRLRAPPQDYFTLEEETDTGELQPRWQNLDLDRYRRISGLPVGPLVLELDPEVRDVGGLIRRWPEYGDAWIDRHKGYAVQWFALALILLVLYVVLNLVKRNSEHD
jgi:surfeit locus 1 family protein